jgi:hypothetical protein
MLDSGLPRVTISGGYAALGGATNLPQGRITNTYELFFNATKVFPFVEPPHVEVRYTPRREETIRFLNGQARGAVGFSDFEHFAGTCTGLQRTGAAAVVEHLDGTTLAHWYRYSHAFYLQDDIKVKRTSR